MIKRPYSIDNNAAEIAQEVLICEFFDMLGEAARHVGETDLYAMLSVHRTTLLRWRTGETRIPAAARALVAILASGIPPWMDPGAWRGFRFERDAVVTPGGRRFTAQALGSLEWHDQYVESLQRRVARLEDQLRHV
ncbi:hypothetical protein D9X30_4913 [Cupriavidus sp. U2]|uniref:DUF3653 domain-containing protein n=1 Tax=Cupriavidus sp. U2 TaxID=2920269 RepID=UPI00129E8753|nr:DUF3653 domain-containing protein [Cupriavidus sp. U2]KAI3589330.1 hypothetical protein D9X30_4913 [Cupriavidus sp. U2]